MNYILLIFYFKLLISRNSESNKDIIITFLLINCLIPKFTIQLLTNRPNVGLIKEHSNIADLNTQNLTSYCMC